MKSPVRKAPQKKSELTRERILERALQLFRKRGFQRTTMRDIAKAAELSLGAAYYYFDSKDAILFAFYARNREQHEAQAKKKMIAATNLRDRIAAILHAGLDTVEKERHLLGALVSRLADPGDAISEFSDDQRAIRERSIALFDSAFEGEPLPPDLRALAAPALWMMFMGMLLYFVHDRSAGQVRTRRLVDDSLDLLAPLMMLGASPLAEPMREQLRATLERAKLLGG